MRTNFISSFSDKTKILTASLPLMIGLGVSSQVQAREFAAGKPIGTVNEAGLRGPMSDNVKVFGSFQFCESTTFDPARNLILAMNSGDRSDPAKNDGYVSLLNPDGSVHTTKWIGASRNGLVLNNPLGSAIGDGILYTVDVDHVRSFDLKSGTPIKSVHVPGATFLNGVAVADDGTVYASNTRNPEKIFKVNTDGSSSVFAEGNPINVPNGVAMDMDGNIVVVNVNDNSVITYNPGGDVVRVEHSAEGGSDGVVVLEDGTKYVSSVKFGSVSRIRPGHEAEVIATGIPSAASMCYDSIQHQLVIPMNTNNAVAFIKL
ncbi:SMP-30/gluconolactonase/LRE family protein [Opitutia bacterium ISCC 51]|nr:SMP-30/gluconolactonase/LRE family protein [Opitutae bacterium ISCC 51]QXD29333.1 SMP-30/gluconolactonase/LRE family protein [Opitutae bacterium ISCC 52]